MSSPVLSHSSSSTLSPFDPIRPPHLDELDEESAQLIAQLLAEDLQALLSSVESKEMDGATEVEDQGLQSDFILTLQMQVRDAQVTADGLIAEKISHSSAAAIRRDAMAARKGAAEGLKLHIDHQYAVRLESALEAGEENDQENLRDADSLLGTEAVNALMLQDPNVRGVPLPGSRVDAPKPDRKGKGKQVASDGANTPEVESDATSEDEVDLATVTFKPSGVQDLCGICFEAFRPSSDPFTSSLVPSSSSRIPFGLKLQQCGHGYCLEDMATYLTSKLEGEGEGLTVVFPIECPSCNDGKDAFDDDTALRILGPDKMGSWIHAREIEARAKFYCPRAKCSALVIKPKDETVTQARCPSCESDLCVRCEAIWHPGLTCEEYQLLPENERSEGDGLLFALAKTEKWRRCSKCKAVVERSTGCYHITCKCRYEFCYLCGEVWNTSLGRCSKGCELFFVPPENQGVDPAIVPAIAPVLQQVHYNPDVEARRQMGRVEGWYHDHGRRLVTSHLPTRRAVDSLICPYCFRRQRFPSVQDLCYHLDHHPNGGVFFCCGKLFETKWDAKKHQSAGYCRL